MFRKELFFNNKKSILRVSLTVWAVLMAVFLFDRLYDGSISFKSFYLPITTFAAILSISIYGFSKKIIYSFLWFFFICISVLVLQLCIDIDSKIRDYVNAVSFSCGSFALISLVFYLTCFIKNKKLSLLSKGLVFIFTALILLFPLSIWAYYLAEDELLTSDIILAFAQTNVDESFEYAESHLDFKWIVAFLMIVLSISATIISLKKAEIIKPKIKLSYILVISLFVMAQSVYVVPDIDYFSIKVLKVTGRQLEQFELFKKAAFLREQRLKELSSIKLNEASGGIHVLVIGESHCKDRMQIYGYKRKNTPNLLNYKDQNLALVFNKAYASFPQTVPALTYALTEQNQYKNKKLEDAFSLIELANVAGYETYWFSNQRKYGMYETPTSVISSAANHEEWINGTSGMQSIFYDDELLKRLPDFNDKKNVLLILHLMGSHQKYSERTPDSFKIFLSEDKVLDSYDASILFVDDFLDKLYKKLSAYPQFQSLTFISDHGEELSGGIYDHNPTKFTFPMVRIPLVIFCSNALKQNRGELYSNLKQHVNKVWTNDLTFDLMLGLLGIEGLPDYKNNLDLSSKVYSLSEKKAMTLYGKKKVRTDKNFNNAIKLRP